MIIIVVIMVSMLRIMVAHIIKPCEPDTKASQTCTLWAQYRYHAEYKHYGQYYCPEDECYSP